MSFAESDSPRKEDFRRGYAWATRGDINAFFGLMLDNIGVMILMASLLVGVFGFPRDFVLTRMIPGTAVGVLAGDLIFTAMAFLLARRTRRSDVTAMPLGLDTPSVFGTVFLVLGPAFALATKNGMSPDDAARHAWFIGIAMILASGIFKLLCAPFCGWIRKHVPRAGLLGSLTAIALVLISFLPLLDIAAQPVAGLLALWITLATLTARWELPFRFPGALAGLLVGALVYYGMHLAGLGPGLGAESGAVPGPLRATLPLPMESWWAWFQAHWHEAVNYLPVSIPLALATVVGGIDCTESAAAAGDEYNTGVIIAVEGASTLVGGAFGGVIQSTPYIGHPAFKAMGARAAYTLATALFVGGAGIFGYFDWIFYLIPKATILPILIFVGLEITSQSFHATKRRHFPAVALSCVPALAYLAMVEVNQVLNASGKPFAEYPAEVRHMIQTLTVLSGGFIVTSLLWGMALAHWIDGRTRSGATAFFLAAVFSLFGIIHSPVPSTPILLPNQSIEKMEDEGRYEAGRDQTPYHWAIGYIGVAVIMLASGRVGTPPTPERAEEPKAI